MYIEISPEMGSNYIKETPAISGYCFRTSLSEVLAAKCQAFRRSLDFACSSCPLLGGGGGGGAPSRLATRLMP